MNATSIRYLCIAIALIVVPAASPVVSGQANFDNVEITTMRLADNLYYLQGQGGQIGVLSGPDGILMVDTQFAPLTDRIVAAIRAVSTEPIKFALNTHVHGDHTGGNSNLATMGVTVMARDELREDLASAENPPARLPMVTYDGAVTFHMNGETVRAVPVPVAHTRGDTMVYFENADVLMTGDFYRSEGYPNIAIQNGGSLEGMLAGLGHVIGASGPDTRILPGHGPIVNRDAVRTHRDMMLVLMKQVQERLDGGMTEDQIVAAGLTNTFDSQVRNPGTTNERFIRQLVQELQ
ncbi:MAG: MBL fold metallo-hydrolase [Acidobacteria bacterium]|nr:MBL fold metallo-hydrolase [Acidobacteriota bacterium]